MDQLSVSRLEKVSGQGSAVSSPLTSGAGQGLIISRMMRKVVKDQLLLVSCSSTVDIRGPNFGESEGMVDINNKARCDECEASTRRVFFLPFLFLQGARGGHGLHGQPAFERQPTQPR